jgi:NAD(P)-dependent dehydrogenase (short-subunit alcohol dehydrogenase family)
MQDRIVLITGASDGIGKATALALARQGAQLAIVGRNRAKTEGVAGEIAAVSGKRPEVLVADLSLPSQVRRLAVEIKARLPRLDVLVNNAGAMFDRRVVNAEGFESTFALNHLNYFILTHHLLPLLRQGRASRIVNVASEAHRGVALDFDDLQAERSFSGFRAYQRSKLANILFTFELARRLKGEKVTVNCLHPGVVASNFGHNSESWWMVRLIKLTQALFAVDNDAGARTSVYLASSPEVDGVSGAYFAKSKVKRPSSQALDEAAASRLWGLTEDLVGRHLS